MGFNGDILGYGDVHICVYIYIKRDRKERKKEGRKDRSMDG